MTAYKQICQKLSGLAENKFSSVSGRDRAFLQKHSLIPHKSPHSPKPQPNDEQQQKKLDQCNLPEVSSTVAYSVNLLMSTLNILSGLRETADPFIFSWRKGDALLRIHTLQNWSCTPHGDAGKSGRFQTKAVLTSVSSYFGLLLVIFKYIFLK